MLQRRIPDWVRHAPVPGIRGFALLSGMESTARAFLVSVLPIVMYRTFQDAETVSEIYFLIGIFSFLASLFTPWLARYVPRRYLYTSGVLGLIAGAALSIIGGSWLVSMGLTLMTVGTVVISICMNAYVMDYVARSSLGECETKRLFYSGAAWAIGPFFGIWIMDIWHPAPFILSIIAAFMLLGTFWFLRLGDGKMIARAKQQAPSPLSFLGRFFKQPRLMTGWAYAVIRSSGWWVYVVYLPIYAVENGYSEQTGGITLSLTNSLLLISPLMLRWMRGRIRYAILIGFIGCGVAFVAAALLSAMPAATIVLLIIGSLFLILLDVCAGLPFLMSVRSFERTEMSAVYSTYRDVSGVVTPGLARIVLLISPLPGVFAAMALGLFAAAAMATTIHPRLGAKGYVIKK
jgi:ACDE family multidrug resistance protein